MPTPDRQGLRPVGRRGPLARRRRRRERHRGRGEEARRAGRDRAQRLARALWLEPLVEVDVGGGRHRVWPVGTADVAGLFDANFLAGGEHALALGPTEKIHYLAKQTRLTFARVGVIDPLSLDDYRAHGGWRGLANALKMSGEQIVAAVTDSGLRGRGGAAFPTGIKWKTVLGAPAEQKYVVCNADEGDSGTFADRMIMEGDPYVLIEGMTIAGLAVGATQRLRLPALRVSARDRDDARRDRRARRPPASSATRIQGGERGVPSSRCARRAGAYICGEETSLLESLEGKRGMVRYRPPLPAIKGLFGKPTALNNVHVVRERADHPRPRARTSTRTTASAARAARCRSSSPAT